jgi:Domain of unknown function (DUF4349)
MTTATRRPRFRTTLAAAAALTVLGLAGACAAGSDSDSGDDSGGAGAAPAAAGGNTGGSTKSEARASRDVAAYDQSGDLDTALVDGVAEGGIAAPSPASVAAEQPAEAPADDQQKLISNGNVQLKSDDVGQAIFDVRKVVDTYAGEVDANATETDDEGDPLRARLQIRVPTAQFDASMQDLERVATLIASSGNTEDVTTEVLDRDIRVQVQRRSIERISLLLDRAVSIRDVVAIEAQLSQRQADLAVLEKEQRYLDDQTAMATINVSVERTKEKKAAPPTKKDDDSGFFAGLTNGWDALQTFGVGLATVLGALLPWMVVVGVLAIPGIPLLRRFRRREPTAPAAT